MRVFASLLLLLLAPSCRHRSGTETIIGIQPIGNVSYDKIEIIEHALYRIYHAPVIVLAPIRPPENAFVNLKSPRYRADKLIEYLKANKPDTVDYIMGITNYDISITKTDFFGRIKEPTDKYEDFGIFGLGYMPGVSCVVSCFRLGRDKSRLQDRLAKICIHEFGHNRGLDHCENKTCAMTDAVEKISTIDSADLNLCEKCRKKIHG